MFRDIIWILRLVGDWKGAILRYFWDSEPEVYKGR